MYSRKFRDTELKIPIWMLEILSWNFWLLVYIQLLHKLSVAEESSAIFCHSVVPTRCCQIATVGTTRKHYMLVREGPVL
jgi:hypothetical protein